MNKMLLLMRDTSTTTTARDATRWHGDRRAVLSPGGQTVNYTAPSGGTARPPSGKSRNCCSAVGISHGEMDSSFDICQLY